MNGLVRAVLVLGLVGGVPMGCAGATPIPSGAQQVHVTATDSSVRLEPSAVRAGTVYLVLDGRRLGVVLVSRKPTAEATPGPMSDDDLGRLMLGDNSATAMEGLSVGCAADQQAENRGLVGYCGNAYKLVLSPGKYALLLDSPDTDPPQAIPAGSIAILEVTP